MLITPDSHDRHDELHGDTLYFRISLGGGARYELASTDDPKIGNVLSDRGYGESSVRIRNILSRFAIDHDAQTTQGGFASMKIWVGVTDKRWFQSLAKLIPDEVNFWQPSGKRNFRVLTAGEPFLFKLHAPDNYVVGGGFFVRYSPLPASLAWSAFGLKNGVASFQELLTRIRQYRRENSDLDPVIGCNVLTEPFFLPREAWVSVPTSFARNIVSGKTYDTENAEGRALWAEVSKRISRQNQLGESTGDLYNTREEARFGEAYLARGRLGQGAFRVLVTDAYQRRCAVTGEKTLPVLEAAHIKPYAENGPHRISNGLLLRADLHKLFDLGYITVTTDLRVEISPRLKEEWQNGREYYAHHGEILRHRPTTSGSVPAREFLEWHNENRFRV